MPEERNKISSKAFMAAVIPALIALCVYLPALGYDFVNWDDQQYVYDNSYIRSLDLKFFRWAFTAFLANNWHPLTLVSYALDYSVWGLNAMGYHLVNIIFHSIDTFLVAIVAVRLASYGENEPGTGPLFTGLLSALLFGLHPLHVESVAWISERKDVLSTFFFLLSVLSYLKYAASSSKSKYAAALFFFILALMSKPMAVSLPAVLLILDFYPLKRLSVRAVLEKTPFFILSAFSALITMKAQAGVAVTAEFLPLKLRIASAIRAVTFYIYKMFVPLDLVPFYPYPDNINITGPGYLASYMLVMAATLLCFFTVRKQKAFLAVWLYYLITLFPVIGVIQVGAQAAADRYTYLPSIGPFILAGYAGGFVLERYAKKTAIIAAGVIAFTVSVALAGLTLRQERIWKDSVTLWSHEIDYYPIFLAYVNRALGYQRQGDFDLAIKDYSKVIDARNRDLSDIYLKRGFAYQSTGDLDLAIRDYTEYILLNPGDVTGYYYRADAYKSRGNFLFAVRDYEKALVISPDNAAIFYNIGAAYMNAGKKDLAIMSFKKAADLGLREAQEYLKQQGIY